MFKKIKSIFGKTKEISSEAAADAIHAELSKLFIPGHDKNIVEEGRVSPILIKDGKAMFSITVPDEQADKLDVLRDEAKRIAETQKGIEKATIVLTANRAASARKASAPTPPPKPQPRGHKRIEVEGVKSIIAVASGKGGVGKSTTSANLAIALANQGLKVGVLDADIYGPSMPKIFGIQNRPIPEKGKKMPPPEAYGVKVMSMGFLVDEETPMIWRAPMVVSAITQFLRDVDWGQLDVLVVDMPPGTGDIQLTMAQQVPLSGAVIVSTPQDLALADARKGIAMFAQVQVPILGVIENMSYFLCPSCGERSDIFGHGGARQEANKIGVPFLGEIPLHMQIRETSDAGKPVSATDKEGPHGLTYKDIAAKLWQESQNSQQTRKPPKIVIEDEEEAA
jgi:ATP-binding protein involved in chromosome partitioning